MKRLLTSLILLAGFLSCLPTVAVMAQAGTAGISTEAGQILNYQDADLRAFIEDVALETRKTIIISPDVRGEVNLVSASPVSSEMLFDIFLSVLRVNGFTAVANEDGVYKIIAADDAVRDTGSGVNQENGERMMTRVFVIEHTDPLAVLAAIKPYVFRGGHSFARNGLPIVIVTDFASNLLKIAEVVEQIDSDKSIIKSLRLENSSALEMADIAEELSTQAGFEDNTRKLLSVIPISGSNTLLLKGLPAIVDQYLPLLAEIDKNNASRGTLQVIKLKYANAEELIPIVEKIAISFSVEQGAGVTTAGASKVQISAYQGGNALIINGDAKIQKRLADMVRQLDVPRAQVLVEAIIVEVSESAAKELGLQYILAGGNSSNIPFTVANYSNTAPNVLAASGALLVDDKGGNGDSSVSNLLKAAAVDSFLGLNGFALGAAGQTNGGGIFGVVLNALATDSDSNILSTPSIMTLDNEAAKFLAGQEIPITTGEALGSTNSNPFRTIERKNVGIQLEVKPQINENDEIRLNIRQEVSSISGPVAASSGELITNKREVQTTVRARNGEVIVLGGLVQENERISVDKVPLLGDIPLLGRAFRSEGRSKEKTNLMIFLRPTIVRNADDMQRVTSKKYDYISDRQQATGAMSSVNSLMETVVSGALNSKQGGN